METKTRLTDRNAASGTAADDSAPDRARRPSQADRAIRWATTASVIVLAGIAALVSYKHMHVLVRRYGETSWTAALLPVSVDGMIAVSSMTLLAESRRGRHSGFLPWALLLVGSVASLRANVAVAEPSTVGRLIAAWPSAALIGSYELLMGQIRRNATEPETRRTNAAVDAQSPECLGADSVLPESAEPLAPKQRPAVVLQRQAWQWALSHREVATGTLPSGKAIADHFGRRERWGRLVKQAGLADQL